MASHALAVAGFEIPLESGLRIQGEVRVLEDGRRKPVVLLGHGFRGHRLWSFWPEVARRFAEQGYYTVSFDFSRIAAEEDQLDAKAVAEAATFGRELADWEALVSRLRSEGLGMNDEADSERIAVLGHSRAAGSGLLFAARRTEARAFIAWNGGVSSPLAPVIPDGIAPSLRDQAIIADLERNADRYDVYGAYDDLPIPALVVQGGADHERLLKAVSGLQEAYPDHSVVWIPGADHTFGAKHPYEGFTKHLEEAFDHSIRFLRRAFADQENRRDPL
ncbi:MAG: dienelactone hydrolase family protein [Cohnella sp.]|nr:dienelactone hydrolase family protein [Cohnella sp.]